MPEYGTSYSIGQGWYRAAINAYFTGDQTDDTARYRVSTWGQMSNINGWNPSELWRAWWNGSSYVWTKLKQGNATCSWSSGWSDTSFDEYVIWTEPKGHSAKTLWFACEFNCGGGKYSRAQISLNIPAKTSYTVSFNANGGSDAPGNQTKWYNETLTLPSTKPTRSGYAFLGWATSSSGSVAYSAGGSYTSNSGATLYAIWKPQASTLTSVTDITLGNAPTVTWTPLLDTFEYKITYSIGSWSYTTDYIAPQSTSEQTYNSYAIPTTVASQITSASTGTLTCKLDTYDSNHTLLGSSSKTFTATVPASLKPTVSATLTPTGDNATVNSWGIYVAGYSKVRCQATGTAQQGATIVSVQITGTVSANASTSSIDYTTGVLTAGTKPFTFTVTDSRGMTSDPTTLNAVFMSYSAPEITSFTAQRRDAPNNTVVDALATWTWTEIGQNQITKTFQYRASTSATWNNVINDQTSPEISSGTTKTLAEIFTDSVSYYLKLAITDSLNNASTVEVYIPTINVWMHMPPNGTGVAFGKTSETGNFEINYDLEVYGDADIQDSLSVSGLDHTITQEDYYDIANLIANPYKTTLSYEVGDWVTYNSSVWECTTATTGTWNASDWREIDDGS